MKSASKSTSLLRFVKEEVIGSENSFLAWCLLAAVVVILSMGVYLNSPNASFHGIAGSRELNVNFTKPVEVKRVHVIPGQKVRKGELLVELKGQEFVHADSDGVVGSIYFARGESVPAFATLLTLSPESPTFVQGYVHEALKVELKLGMLVRVKSATGKGKSVPGRVASLGARFVEIPSRLSGSARGAVLGAGNTWGREVVVEIPRSSTLLLGEKVMIAPAEGLLSSLVAHADHPSLGFSEARDPVELKIPASISAISKVEASGATFLEDVRKFVVISDDTDKNHSPILFVMDEDGELEDVPLLLPGVRKLKDGESLSSDAAHLYVMSSMQDPKESRKLSGNLFARFRRNGVSLTNDGVINFGKVLRELLLRAEDPKLRTLYGAGLDGIEVEAHTVLGDDLLLGLKVPQDNEGDSVILRVRSFASLFAAEPEAARAASVSVDRLVHFSLPLQRISDFCTAGAGETLYVVTTHKKGDGGALWSLGKSETVPKMIRQFSGDRPEGLAYNSLRNQFVVFFDAGDNGSRTLVVNGNGSRRGN